MLLSVYHSTAVAQQGNKARDEASHFNFKKGTWRSGKRTSFGNHLGVVEGSNPSVPRLLFVTSTSLYRLVSFRPHLTSTSISLPTWCFDGVFHFLFATAIRSRYEDKDGSISPET
jgi:hypothetical protein